MKNIGGFSTVFFTQHTEHRLTCFPRSLPVVFTSPGSSAWFSKDFDSDILQCLSKAAEICSFRFTVCNHFSLLPATSLAFSFHVLGGSLASAKRIWESSLEKTMQCVLLLVPKCPPAFFSLP